MNTEDGLQILERDEFVWTAHVVWRAAIHCAGNSLRPEQSRIGCADAHVHDWSNPGCLGTVPHQTLEQLPAWVRMGRIMPRENTGLHVRHRFNEVGDPLVDLFSRDSDWKSDVQRGFCFRWHQIWARSTVNRAEIHRNPGQHFGLPCPRQGLRDGPAPARLPA